MNNGLNNFNTNIVATFFLVGYIAELIFIPHIGFIKYLFAIPLIPGCCVLYFNKEYPIQAGRFTLGLLLCLIATISPLIINSGWFSRI